MHLILALAFVLAVPAGSFKEVVGGCLVGTEELNCFKSRKKTDAGMEGWVVGGKGRVGDCYANAICSSSTHCSPGIHKHDGRNGGDDDARCELV